MTLSRARAYASIVATAAVLFGAPRTSDAAVLVVTNLGDTGAPGQLRTLINAAAPGDTIVIPPGTIVLSGAPGEDANAKGDLDILKALTIVGAGSSLTAIRNTRTDRVIDVLGTGSLVLSGVTLGDGAVDSVTPGGAVRNRGTLRLIMSVVENSLSGGGGGVFNDTGAALFVESTTIRNNVATGISGAGGGIFNFGVAEITESTISGNKATGASSSNNGGGFENIGRAALTNVTISGNSTSGRGGGVFQGASADKLQLINVTIAGNSASIAAGGLQDMARAAHTEFGNTILAANAAPASNDCNGVVISASHNLVQDPGGCTIVGDPTGNILGAAAGVLPLADNGGPTWTMMPAPGAPVVDAGTNVFCPRTDQRGVPRPRDGGAGPVCDMGAVER